MKEQTMYTSFTLNEKTHVAVKMETQDQIAEWARTHFPRGAVITACRLSLRIESGEVSIPGHPVTCGNCRRSRYAKEHGAV